MKRRSRSKLLRPFKELKRLDPFNRRLMEEAEGIDTAYIEAVRARRHDDGGVRPNAQRTRSVPDFPRSELTVHGVPDYAQSGYQGVDISSFDLESILSADADDKMPYDKYGLSAPIMAKPDDIAPPKAVAVAPSQSAPKSKAKPLPAADPKAAEPPPAAPKAAAPATAGGVKPGDSKPEETAKAVPPPKEEGPKLEAVAPPKSGAEAPTTDGVEWPDVGDSSSTKYGVPDYSNGFEGDDAANIPSADSDSPPQSESDSMEMAEDEASRHNTEIAIYYLVAGQSLFEHNTVSGAKPHAPAIAKPFHIIDDFRCDDGHQCGVESVLEPEVLSMRCVFGKDGTENDYDLDGAVTIDNSGCFDRELFLNFKTMTVSKPSSSSKYTAPLIWSLAMIAFGAAATMSLFCCTLYFRRSDYKQLAAANPGGSRSDCHSIDDDLETEKLTATTHGRYDGGSSQ